MEKNKMIKCLIVFKFDSHTSNPFCGNFKDSGNLAQLQKFYKKTFLRSIT